MKDKVIGKMLLIVVLVFCLKITLFSVSDLISTRTFFRQEAEQSIVKRWGSAQKVIGPILKLHLQSVGYVTSARTKTPTPLISQYYYFLPEELNISSITTTELRSRGIYSFPSYLSTIKLTGVIKVPKNLGLNFSDIRATSNAQLLIGLTDAKGLADNIQVTVGNRAFDSRIELESILNCNIISTSLNPINIDEEQVLNFDVIFKLKGINSLQVAALSKRTNIDMQSDWSDPSFIGEFLPDQKTIAQDSFKAAWQLVDPTFDNTAHASLCNSENCDFDDRMVGFELFQSITAYQKVERSIKYATLFILLTFASFFICEVVSQRPLHLIQYSFIGFTQAIFYLLLLSMSEHFSFTNSYIVATIFCVILMSYYLSGAMKSKYVAISYGTAFACLYGILYILLMSEDYALLLGTTVLFTTLAAAMIATRRVDWYQIAKPNNSRL